MVHKFTVLEKLLLNFNVIPHPVIDALTYVVAGRGLQVAAKIGIFDDLSIKPMFAKELAKSAKSSVYGVTILLDILDSFGYVKVSQNGRFSLTKKGVKFFSKDSKSSLRNTILFSDYVFNTLKDLEKHVKRGGPENVNLDVFTPKQWDIFNKTMIEIARSNASEIANLIPLSRDYKKLLDVGGSHGLHAIEICKKVPSLSAEVLDLKPVEPYADRTIKEQKMGGRVKFRVGDFLKNKLGKNYDIILAFNVIHGLTPEINRKLTSSIYKALNPGGIYVVLEQIKDALLI